MEFSCEEKCCPFPSIYLFVQLFISAWPHRYLFYFVGYNLIQSLFMLLFNLFWLWPLGAPLDWLSCVFSTCPYPFLNNPLLAGTIKCSKLILHFPCPCFGTSYFSKELYLVPCFGEWFLETKIWALSMLSSIEVLLPLGPLSGQS